jgi:hypothetical protein
VIGQARKLAVLSAFVIALASSATRPSQIAISVDSLRANLSYLASDALEGRGTPSHGLDLAANYIAAQFQSAGLEPAAPDYFQPAQFDEATANLEGFELALTAGGKEIKPASNEVRVQSFTALDFSSEPVVRLPLNGAIPPIQGKIVAGDERRYGDEIFLNELESRKPALILIIGKSAARPRSGAPPAPYLDDPQEHPAPVIRVRRSDGAALLAQTGDLTVSLHLAKPALKESTLRNVAALLRGSDPNLRNQYVLMTAHYDHLGRVPRGIFYGANDNASGTVSIMEIARALAALNPRPKRSILFVALFGEEEGLLGAYYYAHHPLVPLKETIANVNLEQMGRTDDPAGPRRAEFAFTGPSFSNLPAIMTEAAVAAGVQVYTRKDADDYFDRSDNYVFAQFGVISHTIAVAFEYPDYHKLGDKPDKIDYPNMATVDRGVAAGILSLANNSPAPKWSTAPGAAPYRDAGK